MNEAKAMVSYIKNRKNGKCTQWMNDKQYNALHEMDLFSALSLAYFYGRAKGYRAAKAESRKRRKEG